MRNRITLIGISLTMVMMTSCQHESISYSEQIKPLLNDKCLRCHGGIRANGGFSLLFKETALARNESGRAAIIPGNGSGSELIRRLKADDPEIRMPQDAAPLSAEEVKLLEDWIDQGANWDDHWSFVPPRKAVPLVDNAWVQHDIDRFILAKMQEQKLTPAPPAQKHELLRRAALDITGLPPDLSLSQEFMRSEIGYEEFIDRLLDSRHYGEHWASMWLDLARYSDTKGYEKDAERSIWRYRDYVIKAFNDDMPFDQFSTEQLAGDLLEDPTTEQLIATAYHRNTMTNEEGGTEDEEYRVAAVVDRVNTTFEVWQGMTMSCVQCHSHPYDPIRHEEYYQAYALFNNTLDADLNTEYPFIVEPRDSLHREQIDGLLRFLDAPTSQHKHIELQQMRSALSPVLTPWFAHDYQNVLMNWQGGCNNSSYNTNNQKFKDYFLQHRQVELSGLTAFRLEFSTRGSDGLIEIYSDRQDGTLLCSAPLPNSRGKIVREDFPIIEEITGSHDLVVKLINTTDAIPGGIFTLHSIEPLGSNPPLSDQDLSMRDSLFKSYASGTVTPILANKDEQLTRTTQVHDRGSYLAKTDTVYGGVPGLYRYSEKVKTRLDLAKWLISADNPLTARVYVNRIWNQLFGKGLVLTLDDFGSQAEVSPHRDLLDYLAVQFATDWHWSTKRLISEITQSATYQQSAYWNEETRTKDPLNTYYTRGSRVRLSAEQIRDQALYVSGLFNPQLYGPSVMPAQPPGIWKVPYSGAKWTTDTDGDQYRRGLYTFWRRTTAYPSMVAFDSPSREVCVSQRINTNTPLQALVTLNDPVFVEAAQHLGDWMSTQKGSPEQQIRAGFRKALYRDPTATELDILMDLLANGEDEFDAEQGGLRGYDLVGNALLNMDALLTKS